MRKRFLLIGLLFVVPGLANAALSGPLYERTLEMTKRTIGARRAELLVIEFTVQLLQESNFAPNKEAVELAVVGEPEKFLSAMQQEYSTMTMADSTKTADDIANVVTETEELRTLGRDLQIIASSYEVGSDGMTGRVRKFTTALPSIVNIWQSGSDKMTNPIIQTPIRGGVLAEDENAEREINRKVSEVGTALQTLVKRESINGSPKENSDDLAAAIHRYRHGVPMQEPSNQLQSGCQEGEGDGTELERLTMRWCDVEQKLFDLWQSVPKDFDPPLKPNEIVVYENKNLEELGVIVWIREDNVGLLWEMPMEPVFPSLINTEDEIVLGGTYPDAPPIPDFDEGICSHPFGKRGYLCREVAAATCPESESDSTSDENTIRLVNCTAANMKGDIRTTPSGPDICGVGGWRIGTDGGNFTERSDEGAEPQDTAGEDEELIANECSNCAVDFVCGSSGEDGGNSIGGSIEPKDENGRIVIGIDGNQLPAGYTALHYMVRAQKACNRPAADFGEIATNCCATVFDPNLVTCKAIAEDGNFDGRNISIEACAGTLTNYLCSNYMEGENPCTKGDTGVTPQQIFDAARQNKMNVATSCQQVVDAPDARLSSVRESLKQSCSPNCKARYENSIGNNLCYVGQCIEESMEEHRLIPGRAPLTAGDEAFPWDVCAAPDPQYAGVVAAPPLSERALPRYENQSIVQQLDSLFCEANGYPRLTPPVLCGFDLRRRLALTTDQYSDIFSGIASQQGEQLQQVMDIELSSGNIAARLTNRLVKDYLGTAIRNTSDLVNIAATLLKQIGETTFTTTMCPRNGTLCEPSDSSANP